MLWSRVRFPLSVNRSPSKVSLQPLVRCGTITYAAMRRTLPYPGSPTTVPCLHISSRGMHSFPPRTHSYRFPPRKVPSGSAGGGETEEIRLEGEERSVGDGEGEAAVECGGVVTSGGVLAGERSGGVPPTFLRRSPRERATQRTRLVSGCSHSRMSAQAGAKHRWS